MSHQATRRQFLQASAVAGIGYWVAGGVQAQESKSPNERIAMASIGYGNKGVGDFADAGKHGDMVTICDVDEDKLDAAARSFPKAKKYVDFRKMLDEMGKSIDAVTVSTPDHMHAAAALMAMRMGKHAFVQKPMTRTIYEARLMAEVARKMKVATEMGNQYTASESLRKAAAALRQGVVGTVKEVHVWTNRPIWPQGRDRAPSKECPKNLHWLLWLGAAPVRPYAENYHPFAWRGWWDFGSGALGDMACHTVNMPYMGLDLKNPTSVQAECSGHNGDSYPDSSVIHFEFPANDWRPALKFTWYDGGEIPPPELFNELISLYQAELKKGEGKKAGGKKASVNKAETKKAQERKIPPFVRSGCIVVGDKATLFSPGDYAERKIKLSDGKDLPEVDFVKSPGHFEEWVRAIKGGEPARSNFPDYAGGLTETILLGNLAVWVAATGQGEKVEWDAQNLKSLNVPGLEQIIKPIYRPGYTLDA